MNFDSWINLLKIISYIFTAFFAVLALLVKYKNERDKVTRWGKIALAGIAFSLGCQLALHIFETNKAKQEALKAEAAALNAEAKANVTIQKLEEVLFNAKTTADQQKKSLEETNDLKIRLEEALRKQELNLEKTDIVSKDMQASIAAQRELRKKSDEIADLNKRIAESQQELRKRSDENTALYKKYSSILTGGDSYCYVTPSTLPYRRDSQVAEYSLRLVHKGKYYLYDVLIEIMDIEKMKQYPEDPIRSMVVERKYIGLVEPYHSSTVGTLHIPDSDRQYYVILITARNGNFSENITFRRIRGEWAYALQVRIDGTTVFEEASTRYPRDNTGKVEW